MHQNPVKRIGKTQASGIGYDRPLFAYFLNAPSLIAIFMLAGYPILYSAWISLHKYNLKRPKIFEFIGLDNYAYILESSEFWSSLWITVQFTVLVVTAVTVLGVCVALLLHQPFRGRAVLRRRSRFDFDQEVGELSRIEQAVAFLALLDLRRSGEIKIEQAAPFAPIRIFQTDVEREASWTVRSA